MFFLNSDQVGMGGMHHPKSYCFDWVGGGVGKSPPLFSKNMHESLNLVEKSWSLNFKKFLGGQKKLRLQILLAFSKYFDCFELHSQLADFHLKSM